MGPYSIHPAKPRALHFDREIQAWKLSRYADVVCALRDARFSAHSIEGRTHLDFRRAAQREFSRERVAFWGRECQASAREKLAALRERGRADFVTEFAIPWCQAAAGAVCGVSGSDLFECAREVFLAAADPFDPNDPNRAERARRATTAMAPRFSHSLGPLYMQAFVAISQTLPCLLTNARLALPARLQRPVNRTTIDELLRYAGPTHAILRTAKSDVMLGKKQIRANSRLLLMLASANRDPQRFPKPNRLDFNRGPIGHLAFGAGGHSCIGSRLIHVLAASAISAIARSCPSIEVLEIGPCVHFAIRSPAFLQVRFL